MPFSLTNKSWSPIRIILGFSLLSDVQCAALKTNRSLINDPPQCQSILLLSRFQPIADIWGNSLRTAFVPPTKAGVKMAS